MIDGHTSGFREEGCEIDVLLFHGRHGKVQCGSYMLLCSSGMESDGKVYNKVR